MGDSDEEYGDRRRGRDKFRRERNDYENRERRGGGGGGGGGGAGGGGSGAWEDRGQRGDGWGNRERRDSFQDYGDRRRRYSPQRHDASPPQMKRMRRDWDESGGGGGRFSHYDQGGFSGMSGGGSGGGNWGGDSQMGHYNSNQAQRSVDPEYPTQPPMMSFKQFLASQDDNITDDDAIKKFNVYKQDFKKQQMEEFFKAHKEEEWFKAKYHPEECDKRQEEQKAMLLRRRDIFMRLLEMGRVEACSLDVSRSADIIKLLDAAVILMEGGTEFDLKVLDSEIIVEAETPSDQNRRVSGSQAEAKSDGGLKVTIDNDENGELEEGEEEDEDAQQQKNLKKREYSSDSDSGSSSSDSDDDQHMDDDAEGEPGAESTSRRKYRLKKSVASKKEKELLNQAEKGGDVGGDDDEEKPADDEDEEMADKTEEAADNKDEAAANDTTAAAAAAGDEDDKDPPTPAASETNGEEKSTEAAPAEDKPPADSKEEKEEDLKPKAHHRTNSIFLRNLAPAITKQEVEAMCRRYPGFLRVALQDPQPERKFLRRGWVTFDRTVNIKDICWNLNNIRLRDCEMGAIVNKELKQRVRPVSGLSSDRQVAKSDIKHLAKIVQNFDNQWNMWGDSNDEKKDAEKDTLTFGIASKNPIMPKNITDYLVDEGSYEEEAYLGGLIDDSKEKEEEETIINRDEELLQVIDKMVLYLRVVHSFDYYSAVEYPNEDEMPHKCGIMHVRGPAPPNRLHPNELNDWSRSFEMKVAGFVNLRVNLDEHDLEKLGKKNPDVEVEKFIQANTQELAKDKWLCPLSGKKFKGPEFVRKHILNKHAEKVEEFKQEVAYFNNYLKDPKRPMLPDHPTNRSGGGAGGGAGSMMPPPPRDTGGYSHRGGYQGHSGPPQRGMNYQRPPMYGSQWRGGGQWRGGSRGGGGGHYHNQGYQNRRQDYRQHERRDTYPPAPRRERERPDPRGIVEYRDLDAPEDVDIF